MSTLSFIDLHCDLLSYLAKNSGASAYDVTEIGAAKPHLEAGNVKVQITAIFTSTQKGSSRLGLRQGEVYRDLIRKGEFKPAQTVQDVWQCLAGHDIGILCAIENASSFCEEDENLSLGFKRLENIIAHTGKVFYIMLTHHTENRFGGGNYSDNIGIKDDGKKLLDYLDNRKIAVDLSHASDALAHDILSHITRYNLNVPIIASHSNFRPLWNHVRNLPDEFTQEIIQRNGLIGINFMRDYIHTEIPEAIYDQFQYGLEKGAEKVLAFGADFFYLKAVPDRDPQTLFFPEHSNASKYPAISKRLQEKIGISQKQIERIAWRNVVEFMERLEV